MKAQTSQYKINKIKSMFPHVPDDKIRFVLEYNSLESAIDYFLKYCPPNDTDNEIYNEEQNAPCTQADKEMIKVNNNTSSSSDDEFDNKKQLMNYKNKYSNEEISKSDDNSTNQNPNIKKITKKRKPKKKFLPISQRLNNSENTTDRKPNIKNDDEDEDEFFEKYTGKENMIKHSQNRTNRMPKRYNNVDIEEAREIDLHNMNAVDAEATVLKSINDAENCNNKRIAFITGRGLHSEGSKPVLSRVVSKQLRDLGYKPMKSEIGGKYTCVI